MAYLLGVNVNDIPSVMNDFSGIQGASIYRSKEKTLSISTITDIIQGKLKPLLTLWGNFTRTKADRHIPATSLYPHKGPGRWFCQKSLINSTSLFFLTYTLHGNCPFREWLLRLSSEKVKLENKILCPKKPFLKKLKKRNLDILITMGAGDIDRFVEPIRKLLSLWCYEETEKHTGICTYDGIT